MTPSTATWKSPELLDAIASHPNATFANPQSAYDTYVEDPQVGMMGLVMGKWRPSGSLQSQELVPVFQLDRSGLFAMFHAPPNDDRAWPAVEQIMTAALRPIWAGDSESLLAWIQAANRNATESPACRNQWTMPEPCEEYAAWTLMPTQLKIPARYEFTDSGWGYGGDVRLVADDWLLSVDLGSWQLRDSFASLRITPDGRAMLDGIDGFEGESEVSYGQKVDAWLAGHELPPSHDIELNGSIC